MVRAIYHVLLAFGFDPRRTFRAFLELPRYLLDLATFLWRTPRESLFDFGAYPIFGDRTAPAGATDTAYFHQDLLVARRIFERRPKLHMDAGSRIDGFVAHVASFRQITVLDIRPIEKPFANATFVQADLMGDVSLAVGKGCDSLSCLHVLEHLGLGRYGDRLDYFGYLKGLANLHLVLEQGGTFYLSVPIGPQRIEFNAHRVFSTQYLVALLERQYRIERFSFIDDRGALHDNVQLTQADAQRNFGCNFGCGIFEMTKL